MTKEYGIDPKLIPHHHDFLKVDAPAGLNVFKKEFITRVPDGRSICPVYRQCNHL